MPAERAAIIVENGVVEEKIPGSLKNVRRKWSRGPLQKLLASFDWVALFDVFGPALEALANCVVDHEVLLEVDREGVSVGEAGGGKGNVGEEEDAGDECDGDDFAKE